ncbi:caspase family protein, partial [Desulfobulbus sp. F5]|nr:caspase family protein [Desulfobulbus sp. F5]
MERRSALLISSSEYEDANLSRLTAPPHDVRALAEVLRDASIGSFEVKEPLINKASSVVREAIADFFAEQKRDDLALLYFSGHGLKDDLNSGNLYLTATDTKRDRLRATGLAASFLLEEVEESKSRRIILILDCCYSGAFARGSKGADEELDAAFKNMGYGRVVLTASNAVQLAYEDEQAKDGAVHSIFTKFLLEGLRTGAADLSQRGKISVNDLYQYVDKQIKQMDNGRRQTPKIWDIDREGEELVIARNPFWTEKKQPDPIHSKRPLTYTLRPQAHNFVDRIKQRKELRSDLLDATKVFVIVDGLAGIGKTMLAAKVAEESEADFSGIYYSKCAKETDVDQLLAELAYFLSGGGDHCLSGVVEYDIPAANKINFLLAALGVRKYLLIFDDVHELLNSERQISNEGIKLLFSELLNTRHQAKILLVSRVRPVLPWQQLCQVPSSLESFDEENGLELLRLLGLDEDEELLRRAWQLTGGHPLAMGLLAGMAGTMDLQLILAETSLFYGGSLVNELLRRQFYTLLTVEEKNLLLRMSVLLRPAEFTIIAHLEEQGQAARLLPALVEKNLVMYSRKEKKYRLHDLVREFSRAETTAEEQQLCHSRLADYYERLEFNADKPSFEQVQQRLEAQHHAVQSGEKARAARLLVETAEHLRKWGYLERCGKLLAETLSALEKLEPTKEHLLLRVDLLVEQGWLERSSSGLDKAVERCREAERILQTAQDEGREGKVCHSLGKFFYEEALWEEAEQYFVRAFELQKAQRNSKELAKILCDWRLLYWNRAGELDKIEAVSLEGINVCEEKRDVESKCKILIEVLGKSLEDQSKFDEALAVYQDSLDLRTEKDFSGRSSSLRRMG